MNENITCKSIKLLIKEIKEKKYINNLQFDIIKTNYLINKISNDLENLIHYSEFTDKEIYRIRKKNIYLSNKLTPPQIELFNLKKTE